jgi:hypothetical protein
MSSLIALLRPIGSFQPFIGRHCIVVPKLCVMLRRCGRNQVGFIHLLRIQRILSFSAPSSWYGIRWKQEALLLKPDFILSQEDKNKATLCSRLHPSSMGVDFGRSSP